VESEQQGWAVRIAVAVLLMWASAGVAQTATEPTLHQRGSGTAQNSNSVAPVMSTGKQKGTSTLPQSAQGEFMLDETGSVVQITIENGILDGYISKLVEGQTASLTYFFDHTLIKDKRLTFTTKQIHGTWYSFDGTIVRGDAASKQETGFYRLKGTWIVHDEAGKNQSTSTVSLKSTPRSGSESSAN
jgi:hypothetical protein